MKGRHTGRRVAVSVRMSVERVHYAGAAPYAGMAVRRAAVGGLSNCV